MQCAKCRQVHNEAGRLCPACMAAEEAVAQMAVRGGIKGAAIGLLLGLAIVAPILAFNEINRSIKGIAVILPLTLLITGFMLGMVKARKD